MMVTGVIIPHDEDLAARQHQFQTLDDYQRVVGGIIEAIDLDDPSMSVFLNEEGKLMGLPINRRATALWWLHCPPRRHRDVIVGDAVLVGPPGPDGETLSVPPAFLSLLFETSAFKVEVNTIDDPEGSWNGNARRFDDYFTAARYALDLRRRWTAVEHIRVVPA